MIIKQCEIYFAKLDPKRPNAKYDKERPTWEIQIRTTSKEVKKQWEAMKLHVTPIVPDEGAPYYRVNLRRKSVKADGSKAEAPRVVNGSLQPLDGNTIGNGSIGNVHVYQYEFDKKTGGRETASVLMGVQITKHLVYRPDTTSEFEEAETETVEDGGAEAFGQEEEEEAAPPPPVVKGKPKLGPGVKPKPDALF
jgi:hypothetical protein